MTIYSVSSVVGHIVIVVYLLLFSFLFLGPIFLSLFHTGITLDGNGCWPSRVTYIFLLKSLDCFSPTCSELLQFSTDLIILNPLRCPLWTSAMPSC